MKSCPFCHEVVLDDEKCPSCGRVITEKTNTNKILETTSKPKRKQLEFFVSQIKGNTAKLFSFKAVVILLLLVILVGLFYWFQIRPSQIKRDCSRKLIHREASPPYPAIDEWQPTDDDEYYYCLRSKGL